MARMTGPNGMALDERVPGFDARAMSGCAPRDFYAFSDRRIRSHAPFTVYRLHEVRVRRRPSRRRPGARASRRRAG